MNKFFLTGPNRTGTTLLARCIDDHPKCICLFETNVHVTMLGGQSTMKHGGRMKAHGLKQEQINDLLQKSNGDILSWYDRCGELLKEMYQKPELTHLGDKNPFFHEHPVARKKIQAYPCIWTIRDPRAIWYSRATGRKEVNRVPLFFNRYINNVRYFLHRLGGSLVIRFEDLVSQPEPTMKKVYEYLGVEYDDSFMTRTAKRHDRRFKWNPNSVDPFDSSKIDAWREAPKKLPSKFFTPLVKEVMQTFNYI